MKTTLASIIKKVQARMADNWYIDTDASLNDAIWTFVFSDCLHIEDQLNQIRRGSYFSIFHHDEIEFVKRYDTYIAGCMYQIWLADNDWCSDMDELPMELMKDGIPDDDVESYDRYKDSIEVSYLDRKWEAYADLEEYVAKKYAIIQADIDASRYDDIKNYFYYKPAPVIYEKEDKNDDPELPCESIPVWDEYLEEIIVDDETGEFEEDLSERTETPGFSDASPEVSKDLEVTEETPLDALNLTIRSYNCLRRAGIQTIMQLARMDAEELSKIRSLRNKSQKEIRDKLTRLGLS